MAMMSLSLMFFIRILRRSWSPSKRLTRWNHLQRWGGRGTHTCSFHLESRNDKFHGSNFPTTSSWQLLCGCYDATVEFSLDHLRLRIPRWRTFGRDMAALRSTGRQPAWWRTDGAVQSPSVGITSCRLNGLSCRALWVS